MTLTIRTTTKNKMLEQLETDVKLGSVHTNPRVVWLEGSTVLAQVDLKADEPFDPAASGEIVLNAVADDAEWTALSLTPEASGTCDSIQVQDRDYAAVITLTGANMGLAETTLSPTTPLTFSAAPKWSI